MVPVLQTERLRLRPAQYPDDCAIALPWYRDPEVLYFSEGEGVEPYDLDTVKAMYKYLMGIGELYILEARTPAGEWVPIGDATLSPDTLPIVIGEKAYRSRGIGKLALGLLVERARALGWKKLKAKQIYTYNIRSHNLFAGFGFRVVGTGADDNGNSYNSYELNLE